MSGGSPWSITRTASWPFLSPDDVTHYDVGKLAQWRVVFEHAQRRGIALHIVLNETAPDNRRWLDQLVKVWFADAGHGAENKAAFDAVLAERWAQVGTLDALRALLNATSAPDA